jgi:molybdopterin synthase catalytic subunit
VEIISGEPIEPSRVYELIRKAIAGSVVLHFGIVRESTGNKRVKSMEFVASGDVEEELRTISEDIRKRWNIEDVLIMRRLGRLNIGDVIALVAVSSPHRGEAFDACREGVDRLKKMSTIVENETFRENPLVK